MSLREHIDFHNRELISIVEFARLWSAESGNSLSEVFEFLRVVLKKDGWRNGIVRSADGKRYFHGHKVEKTCAPGGGEKIYPIFTDGLFFLWLEQARDAKNGILDRGYYLTRDYYIALLKSERLPIPAFLTHPSARPTKPPGMKRQTIASAEGGCQQWLAGLMREGPHKVRDEYFKEASSKFPGLTGRGFKRAWSNAIVNAEAAEDWSKPGRKSQK